ncbi:carbohydrate-binding module family 13 protein [Rhizophagus irregularis DAOM 181602=DAOM 197198]|nr:carbohydrate-binding module family 13 protein [Rhizophagus irregularis DAOM 181602=DAOM 197198]
MDDIKFLPKLSQNLLEILNDEEYYDVTIEVGNDPNENDGTLSHIKLPNILPEIFQIILRYIYGGRLSLKDYDTSDIIRTIIAASELNLQELIIYLQSFLIENEANWMEKNFDFVYQTSFENDSLMELQKYCTDLMTKEPDIIFKSPKFSSIPEKLLISIIQNDNLQLSEIQIWEHILNWGLAQNPELPSSFTNYSKDDFNTLKNTLQQVIPFIRFYDFTSKEFTDRVLPYKRILPKELYKDLLKTYLNLSDPNSKPNVELKPRITKGIKSITVDSNIITYQYAELILKWVDKLESTDKLTSSYEFNLLFRGSRDGFKQDRFHKICDNHSRTVTIVKVKDSNEILGGYNPIEWKYEGGFMAAEDSFIFSFHNNRIDNHILSRVKDKGNAIFNDPHSGPKFGNNDLIILGMYSGNCCKKSYYEKPIRRTTNQFTIEEFEVFQIV